MSNVVRFPARPGSPEQWVSANPEAFFVAEENRRRRCAACGKLIRAGERHYGFYDMSLVIEDGDVTDCRPTTKIKWRLHPECARELLAEVKKV